MIIESQRNLGFRPWSEPSETRKRLGSDFICRIRFGNLLKNSGDILLCPLGEDFKPSNPLAHWLVAKEGKWLKRKLNTLKDSDYIGTEHAAFLPCRKLKYRGIIFVSVDFYSKERDEVNKERIAEALLLAQKYHCARLSCPGGFLYREYEFTPPYDSLIAELNETIRTLNEKEKINYMIEFVIKRNFVNYLRLKDSFYTYENYTKALFEKFPITAEILPWYRRRIRSIKRVYPVGPILAHMIRHVLSKENVSSRYIYLVGKILTKRFGWYRELDPGITCNKGGLDFLFDFCSEMPWNYIRLCEIFYKDKNDVPKQNEPIDFPEEQRWAYGHNHGSSPWFL